MEVLLAAIALGSLVLLVLQARKPPATPFDWTPLHSVAIDLEKSLRRMESSAKDDASRDRSERDGAARHLRTELLTRLSQLTEANERKLEALRATIDERLRLLQEDNGRKLEEMRTTVDEKLQGTLEKRLGESFKQVSDRLEAVHKGLGEMQTLANGVGDLKKVLTNVKTRGTWGEVQLGAMLEQALAPEQYASNVDTRGSGERVEFAIKFPGQGEGNRPLWLPIDAKFPVEDYQRLVDAKEAGELERAQLAGKQLETRVKDCAADISKKYVEVPRTTDFGILYLPVEGLYAEVMSRPGLFEEIQRKHRVMIAGPSSLWSLLTSLQMGFRTLGIQKHASDVWKVLGSVKTEFGKYATLTEKVKNKLIQATNTMGDLETRARVIGRSLERVTEVPESVEIAAVTGARDSYEPESGPMLSAVSRIDDDESLDEDLQGLEDEKLLAAAGL